MSEKLDPPAVPAAAGAEADAAPGPASTLLRYLTPDMCKIHLGTHGALHVTVRDERIYGGVYAAYAFPVAYSSQYISLIHSGGEGEVEIGLIRDLDQFPPEQVQLVRDALSRRYFIHTITGIHSVGWKYGMVAMDVETDKGRVSFMLRRRHDRAIDYGRRGKVLIDLEDNRYVIPDLEKLSARELADFTRIIYW